MKRSKFKVSAEKVATIRQGGHKPFCFAGEPAPCPGYFENDVLPCICGGTQDVLKALEQSQVPVTPLPEGVRGRQGSEPVPIRHDEGVRHVA